nr:uncharacterized protein LOC111513307 [Leptinotarsa decemlineata]
MANTEEQARHCQQAFAVLKRHLTIKPILAYPMEEGLFIMDTDASQHEIGVVLSQVQEEEEVVISYFSKSLGTIEKNDCVTRKELLAVVKAEDKDTQLPEEELPNRRYKVKGRDSFMDISDREMSSPTSRRFGFPLTRRVATCKDPLSRDTDRQFEESPDHGVVRSLTASESDTTFLTRQDIIVAQKEDPVLKTVRKWIAKGVTPEWQEISKHGQQEKGYWLQWDSMSIQDDLLTRKSKARMEEPTYSR